MCMHVKEEKVKGVALKELCLLQKVIEKTEMSVVSNCLECFRMGRGNRYVSAWSFHIDLTSIRCQEPCKFRHGNKGFVFVF